MNRLVNVLNQTPMPLKVSIDVGAVGVAWMSFFSEALPIVATVLSIIWLSLQITTWVINKKWRKD